MRPLEFTHFGLQQLTRTKLFSLGNLRFGSSSMGYHDSAEKDFDPGGSDQVVMMWT
jgi:hypothetical protein